MNTLGSNWTSAFWRRTVFQWIIVGCLLFVVLTTVAMAFFPGGTVTERLTQGYSFTRNFFSDLGRVQTRTGVDNTISRILFTLALGLAGIALAVFFIAFTQFFDRPLWVRMLSLAGTVLGVGAGFCFVGVVAAPADVNGRLHGQFVLWAFRLFLFAALLYLPALFGAQCYPKPFALAFIAFALLLAGYLWLLTQGPPARTPQGLLIQVVGQKVIAYASIFSVALMSWGALRANAAPARDGRPPSASTHPSGAG